MTLPYHPLANILPLIEGEDFARMVESIRVNGLINPIIVVDGKILDGRNRYRACLKAGVEPAFTEFSGDELEAIRMVEALNLDRRHLTDGQRAIIAAELSVSKKVSRSQAIEVMGVHDESVKLAEVIVRNGSANVIEMVRSGKTSVTRAHKVVTGRLPPSHLASGRAAPGRPLGDTRVNRLIRTCKDLLDQKDGKDLIVKNWRGDPDEARILQEARLMLGWIEGRLKSRNEMVEESYNDPSIIIRSRDDGGLGGG